MTFHPPEHPDYPSVPPPVAMSQGRNALLHAGYALAEEDLDSNNLSVKLVSYAGKRVSRPVAAPAVGRRHRGGPFKHVEVMNH